MPKSHTSRPSVINHYSLLHSPDSIMGNFQGEPKSKLHIGQLPMCALSILHIDPREVTRHLQRVLPSGLTASLLKNLGTLALGLNNRYITILKFQCHFQWQVSSFTV